MAVLRSLLELYGGLDHALLRSDDPDVHEHVDNLFPGASANRGWYDELHRFLSRGRAAPPLDISDPSQALKAIAAKHESLTTRQKSRLYFGIAAHARLLKKAPNALPHLKPEFLETLATGLAVVGPEKTPYAKLSPEGKEALHDHVDHIGNKFERRSSFEDICSYGCTNQFLHPDVAKVRPCRASIVTVDGIRCVVVDTDTPSDDISLDDLKAIVDPRNWHNDYPEFFLGMEPFGPRRPDGWGRVRETVGLGDVELVRQIVTALKYYKSEGKVEKKARVDYDLDDPTPSRGDGQVLVDRGFINMECTRPDKDPAQHGVRVRTRKVVHIRGLRPYTQQRLVCLTGYGTASEDFLFGAAEDRQGPLFSWDTPQTDLDPEPEKGNSEEGATQSKSVPTEPTSHVAQAVANVFSDCIEELTNRNVDIFEKWTTGRLDFTDLANYSKHVSGRLMSSPWEFLQSLNDPWYGPLNRKTPRTP
jgi:hypothetical protein